MNKIINDKSSVKRILTPSELRLLAKYSPDKEMLLTANLCFRHFIRLGELSRLNIADFLPTHRSLESIHVGKIVREKFLRQRHIPIAPEHRQCLQELLPQDGRLFYSRDPYGRLRRFAKKIGIDLDRGIALRTAQQSKGNRWGY